MTRLVKPLGLFLLLLCNALPAFGQQSGILLGLRTSSPLPLPSASLADTLAHASYRTYFITRSNEGVRLIDEAEALLVPQDTVFWHVGAKRSVYNSWTEDFVWATPAGLPPDYAGIQVYNGEYCQGHRTQVILFAGHGLLALEQRSAGYCEGAAHPWNYDNYAVVPLDSTTHMGLPIQDVLGEPGARALQAAATNFLAALTDRSQTTRFLQEPDEANWAVVRRPWRWAVQGRLDTGEMARTDYADLPLNLQLPRTFTGPAGTLPPRTAIRSVAADALDAFASPRGDLLLILHPTCLTAHLLQDGKIGPVSLEIPLPRGGATPVMVQWASGAQLQRWLKQIRPAGTLLGTARAR